MSERYVPDEGPLPEPTCIHGVPWFERCLECWPEEPDDVLPPLESSSNNVRKEDQPKMCRCGKNPATPQLHECPYAAEITDNHSLSCDCCGECEYQCAQDI